MVCSYPRFLIGSLTFYLDIIKNKGNWPRPVILSLSQHRFFLKSYKTGEKCRLLVPPKFCKKKFLGVMSIVDLVIVFKEVCFILLRPFTMYITTAVVFSNRNSSTFKLCRCLHWYDWEKDFHTFRCTVCGSWHTLRTIWKARFTQRSLFVS